MGVARGRGIGARREQLGWWGLGGRRAQPRGRHRGGPGRSRAVGEGRRLGRLRQSPAHLVPSAPLRPPQQLEEAKC